MHPKVLNAQQARVLHEAASFVTSEGFYLGGGLALGLQLGHRRSADFDWFREASITDPARLIRDFEFVVGTNLKPDLAKPNTVLGTVRGLHVSFFRYPYQLIGPAVEYAGMPLASLEDLAAMKLLAIAQRGRKRDFIDLHALLKKFSLRQLIDFFVSKYPSADVQALLRAATYFTDADKDMSPTMISRVKWPTVKRDIEAAVTDYRRAEGAF